jgi:SOS-response transcriptional repressor LexA
MTVQTPNVENTLNHFLDIVNGNHAKNYQLKGLEKQERIYTFIRTFIQMHGYSPSVREIQNTCEISSSSLVQHHLKGLEERGRITRSPNSARTIRVCS